MEWPIADSANAQEEIAALKNPLVRQFIVQRTQASEPLENVQGTWQVASPLTTGKFGTVAYHFFQWSGAAGKSFRTDFTPHTTNHTTP